MRLRRTRRYFADEAAGEADLLAPHDHHPLPVEELLRQDRCQTYGRACGGARPPPLSSRRSNKNRAWVQLALTTVHRMTLTVGYRHRSLRPHRRRLLLKFVTGGKTIPTHRVAADPKKGSLGTVAPMAIGFIVGPTSSLPAPSAVAL